MSEDRTIPSSPPRIVLVNPISGRGHLDAYARLYSRALVELGATVTLVAATDGGTRNYLARNCPQHAANFSFVPSETAEALPHARRLLPAHKRALMVVREEGVAGLARRAVTVPVRLTMRVLTKPVEAILRRCRNRVGSAASRLLGVDANRLSFVSVVGSVRGACLSEGGRFPDLVVVLYLDLMSERPREVKALEGAGFGPWVGILFHPRLMADRTAKLEKYFQSQRARGAIFLVPDAMPVYASAAPTLSFALAPDVADLELAANKPRLAIEIRRRAAGRSVVFIIGSIAPHKGIMTALDVIARVDPKRYFFAIIGEVHWESFGADEAALREFYNCAPENVFIHEGYVEDERDYNSTLSECDILYSVYRGFNSSSNALTKSAGLHIPILVSAGTLMGERVIACDIGAIAPEGDPAGIESSLDKLVGRAKDSFGFDIYLQQHSLERLKLVLLDALNEWVGSAQHSSLIEECADQLPPTVLR